MELSINLEERRCAECSKKTMVAARWKDGGAYPVEGKERKEDQDELMEIPGELEHLKNPAMFCERKYVEVSVCGGGSYYQPTDKLHEAVAAEMDGIESGKSVTIRFKPVAMTEEEYNALPEFTGH